MPASLDAAARGGLAIFAVLLGLLLPAAARATESPTAAPFLAYLAGARPALIAFNPSGYRPDVPAVPAADIARDLQAVRPAFDGLVLYAYSPQLTEAVVGAAAAAGFRAVLFGVWDPRSAAEIEGIAALITRFADRLAFAVCIGNEGLNDNRYTLADIEAAAARLRALLPPGLAVPVTTSEPWGDYGWRPLRGFGDFLAPNIHPALERPALGPVAAAGWARDRALAVARVTGKPVLVKETGWPNGGGPSFTPEGQAAFWRAYLAPGRHAALGKDATGPWVSFAAAFEAFDAPWKATTMASGIEGHWGLLTIDRQPLPAWAVWRSRTIGD